MNELDDSETWLIETGHDVIERKAVLGSNAHSARERLIYCMWVADYGMRNAGDLESSRDLYAAFQDEGKALAAELSLPVSLAAFSLRTSELQDQYFDLFDGICGELREAG